MKITSIDPGLNTGLVCIKYKPNPERIELLIAETWRADSAFHELMRRIIDLRATLYIAENFTLRVALAREVASRDPQMWASQVLGALKFALPSDKLKIVEPSAMQACAKDQVANFPLKTPHEVSALRHAIAYARRKHYTIKKSKPVKDSEILSFEITE